VIFVLSCISSENDFPEVPGAQADELVHFVLSPALGFLMVRWLCATTEIRRGNPRAAV
jgi:hypothetical protein